MGSIVALLVGLGGCERGPEAALQGGAGGTDPSSTDPRSAGEPVVLKEASTATAWWTAAPGWDLAKVKVVGDVDGDGLTDALAYLLDGGSRTTALVRGPLRRSMVLPDDAAATFRNSDPEVFLDFTGDGVLDMLVDVDDVPGAFIVQGPVAGEVDSAQVGTPLTPVEDVWSGVWVADLDGDGIGDRVAGSQAPGEQEILQVWLGPLDRWTGDPSFTIELVCTYDHQLGELWTPPRSFADLTGDGRRELWLDRTTQCSTQYLMAMPEAGTVSMSTDPTLVTGVGPLQVVDDQNGDGTADLWDEDGAVLWSPFAFAADGLRAATTVDVDALFSMSQALPADVTGDGLRDFLGVSTNTSELEVEVERTDGMTEDRVGEVAVFVLVGGTDGELGPTGWRLGVGSDYTYAVDLDAGAFEQDGVVSVLAVLPDGVAVLDL